MLIFMIKTEYRPPDVCPFKNITASVDHRREKAGAVLKILLYINLGRVIVASLGSAAEEEKKGWRGRCLRYVSSSPSSPSPPLNFAGTSMRKRVPTSRVSSGRRWPASSGRPSPPPPAPSASSSTTVLFK